MGVRPPSGDDSGGGSVEFGIAALEAHLDDTDLRFPADADAVVEALGDPEVAYDPGGSTVALSTAMDDCDAEAFDSRRDLLNALHPVFEEYRTSRAGGLFGWVRSLVPGA